MQPTREASWRDQGNSPEAGDGPGRPGNTACTMRPAAPSLDWERKREREDQTPQVSLQESTNPYLEASDFVVIS